MVVLKLFFQPPVFREDNTGFLFAAASIKILTFSSCAYATAREMRQPYGLK
jgi:hypothetical protein